MAAMIVARNLEQDSESSSSPLSIGQSIAYRLWRVSNETLLLDEQELARFNMEVWQEIEECQRKIRHYQWKLESLTRTLNDRTRFTRFTHDPNPRFDHSSKEFSQVILHLPPTKASTYTELQNLLWSDPSCQLRHDREILLASLEWGPDNPDFRVQLSDEMLKDKELVCRLTEKHPCYLLQHDVPEALFDDKDVFRALLVSGLWLVSPIRLDFVALLNKFSPRLRDFIALLNKFSPRLRNDADLMLETILAVRSRAFCYIYRFEKEHFVGESLRDNKTFCLRVADALLPLHEDFCHRQGCLLKFRDLSKRLKLDLDVVSAFCKVDGSTLILALVELQRASQLEAKSNATFMQSKLPWWKESVLLAFEDNGECDLDLFGFYDNLPPELQHDRDVAVAASSMNACVASYDFKELWFHDRDFWFRFTEASGFDKAFETHWRNLPSDLQQDRGLALFVARNAHFSTPLESSSFQGLLTKFPGFLSDRAVVANLVVNFDGGDLANFAERIPREVLEKDFCLELLEIKTDAYVLLPVEWRGDREVVNALFTHYRCGLKDHRNPHYRCGLKDHRNPLSLLPHDIQLQHPDLVAEMIQNTTSQNGIEVNDVAAALRSNNREVVLALITTGHNIRAPHLSWELCNDRDVFLAFAEHQVEGFRDCPTALRQEKAFMLQVVQKNLKCLQYLDESLKDDFDILLAAFSCDQDHARHFVYHGEVEDFRTQRIATFACEVRKRLQIFISFTAFLEGMISTPSAASTSSTACYCGALSLLDQGTDTALAYKKLVAAYAGIPLGDELCMLRRASVGLTRWGY